MPQWWDDLGTHGQSALVGGGLGATLGGLASMGGDDDEDKSGRRSPSLGGILGGAAAGAGLGYLAPTAWNHAKGFFAEKPKPPPAPPLAPPGGTPAKTHESATDGYGPEAAREALREAWSSRPAFRAGATGAGTAAATVPTTFLANKALTRLAGPGRVTNVGKVLSWTGAAALPAILAAKYYNQPNQ